MRLARAVITWGALSFLLIVASCSSPQAQSEPKKPPPPPLEFIGEWGKAGPEPGELQAPAGLAADSVGNVYVTDAASNFIKKFNVHGTPLLAFQETRLKTPSAIAVDRGDAIYVADARGKVLIFYPDGSLLRQISAGRALPHRPARMAIAVDDDGNLFVAERDRNLIAKFNPRGRHVKTWYAKPGAPGSVESPLALAVGSDGFLYVLDSGGTRVQKFSRDGGFAGTFNIEPAAANNKEAAAFLAIAQQSIVVISADTGRVQVISLSGEKKIQLDLNQVAGVSRSNLAIRGAAITSSGELLLLDAAGPRVLRFRINA